VAAASRARQDEEFGKVRLLSRSIGQFGPTVLAAILISGCSSPALISTGQVAIMQPDTLPAPTEADLVAGTRRQLIGPGDTLSVDVFGLPELSRQVLVDANGDVALPLAGTIEVSGMAPEQIAHVVEERLRSGYVRAPQVTVGVVEMVSQAVIVSGEVKRPGFYPVIGKSTLMTAIARAEGTTSVADPKHVVVFRTVGGQQMAALYDLRSIRLGAYSDPQIYTNDVVVVGESTARALFPQIAQISSALLTPLVTVLR
jgi:polysaccharide export outer membrane protein